MAFRADESIFDGFEKVKNYFIPKDIDAKEREQSENMLHDIVGKYGPVIEGYPTWHPLVTHHSDRFPVTTPSKECGYKGLDHTRYFLNAFVTCPYGDGQDVMDSVDELPYNHIATIAAERLDVKLYNTNATPILVSCKWEKTLPYNNMIPASLAIPLMLQKEVPCWKFAECAETWETMRPYFLGEPHGSRSSLFINQETAITMKKVWDLLINTGMFGPIKVSNQR